MYTKDDFQLGSKARVIATGHIMYVVGHGTLLHLSNRNGTSASLTYEMAEPVFEYVEDVEVSDTFTKWYSAKYGCNVHPIFNNNYIRHMAFTVATAAGWRFCRRASSRKSELLKQLEQAREEERKAVEKREELEKELETIK